MNELNISAVDATAMETATTTSAPKHKWLSKLTRGAKKAGFSFIVHIFIFSRL